MAFKPAVSLAACGAATGALAVALEVWGGVQPPQAYGFCMTCHGRDLVDWLANRILLLNWEVAPPGTQIPILTVVGVLLGSYVAATLAGERRSRPASHPGRSILAGILAVNCGLLALGCPTRQVILLGHGDWVALPAVIGVMLGAGLGAFILKWRAGRAP